MGVSKMTRHSFAVQASRYISVVFLGQLHSMLIPSRVRQLRLAQQRTMHGSVWKPQVFATLDQSPCGWHTTAVEAKGAPARSALSSVTHLPRRAIVTLGVPAASERSDHADHSKTACHVHHPLHPH